MEYVEENEDAHEAHPNASSSHLLSAPPMPPFEEGVRTWGELIGILDPMDEAEQIIDPLVVTNGVDRIRRMSPEERSQLAIQLVRFLAILYAEILRMLQMVDQDDVTVLMQVPDKFLRARSLAGPEMLGVRGKEEVVQYGSDPWMKLVLLGPRPPPGDEGKVWSGWNTESDEEVSLMQTAVDKFGVMLQELLDLLERMGQPLASTRATFLLSMLADVQRPGTHISAGVIDRMDRLQALLLSFDEGMAQEASEADREWCFGQWGVLRPVLLDRKRDATADSQRDVQASSSSDDIAFLEDSQENAEGCSSQVAILSNGTTRPLTREEMEEIAFHEQLEQDAAEQEKKADEQRWLEYRAQCLQDEEDQMMQEALAENAAPPNDTQKKARVLVQVEGEGGRVVRSEIFNMVVKDGETLTYKIMVLPKNDPEVRRLRRQQAVREGEVPQASDSNISAASAETVPVDQCGRTLPLPPVVPNEELDAFMKTVEGEEYYRQWLAGKQTCQMVRERSGCGLLAKFFQRKVEEEEDQSMIAEALKVEEAAKQAARLEPTEGKAEGGTGAAGSGDDNGAAPPEADQREQAREQQACQQNPGRCLSAPSTWPSYALKDGKETINLDSQNLSLSASSHVASDVPAAAFTNITPEENEAELAFAIAAGDIPAEPVGTHGPQEGQLLPGDGGMATGLHEGLPLSGDDGDGLSLPGDGGMAAGHLEGLPLTGAGGMAADDVLLSAESSTESRTTTTTEGLVQTTLRQWLV